MEQLRTPGVDGWYTVHEWAARMGKCIRTIRTYTKNGLRHSKIGHSVLIHETDFEDFLRANSRGGNLR